jgi:hypothetical protein
LGKGWLGCWARIYCTLFGKYFFRGVFQCFQGFWGEKVDKKWTKSLQTVRFEIAGLFLTTEKNTTFLPQGAQSKHKVHKVFIALQSSEEYLR